MSFSDTEIQEFKAEALELLEIAEKNLFELEDGKDFLSRYDAIFRSLHNLKGASGMMELHDLQAHTHELENLWVKFKEVGQISKEQIQFFLNGIDAAKKILSGQKVPPLNQQKPTSETSDMKAYPEHTEAAVSEFKVECLEILDRVSMHLKNIEEVDQATFVLSEVFREIHSLKGAASLYGYKALAELTHALENHLDLYRNSQKSLTTQSLDLLFKAIQWIESEVQRICMNHFDPTTLPESAWLIDQLSRHELPSQSVGPQEKNQSQVISVEESREVKEPNPQGASETASSIRVSVALLDKLMNLMGEMVLVRNEVNQFSQFLNDSQFVSLNQKLNFVTSEIQAEMMKTRMQPVGSMMNKFHRVVRELSQDLGKNIQLQVEGAETELDRSLLEAIKDPLTHIVRNSCDHGIESKDVRRASGKSETGKILIKAVHDSGHILIQVSDDGKGLNKSVLLKKAIEKNIVSAERATQLSDKDIFNLIFAPGFSTAAAVTNVSGRGVGMDVVKTNVSKIGGTIELKSEESKGTTISLRIPLTLAIMPAIIFEASQVRFAIPQSRVHEIVCVKEDAPLNIETIHGCPVYRLRDQILPLVDIASLWKRSSMNSSERTIVVVSSESQLFGLLVDVVHDSLDVVVKPVSESVKALEIYSGATILGDGSISLILDVQGVAAKTQIDQISQSFEKDCRSVDQNQVSIKEELQEFLMVKVGDHQNYGLLISYIHRLEEVKRDQIQWVSGLPVVDYRDEVLPLISARKWLEPDFIESFNAEVLNVVVVQRGGRFFGLIVEEILDSQTTSRGIEHGIKVKAGLLGFIKAEQCLINIIDPFQLISLSYPEFNSDFSSENLFHTALLEQEVISSRNSDDETKHSESVLIVEDSPLFRKLVQGYLVGSGYTVELARDGQEAVQILSESEKPFALIISDIEMPRMDGFQLASWVRNSLIHKETPLLGLSSKYDRKYIQKSIEVGYNIYLEKFKPEGLLDSVKKLTKIKYQRMAS